MGMAPSPRGGDVVVVACPDAVRIFRALGLPARGYEKPADALLAIAARPPTAVVVAILAETRGGAAVGEELRAAARTTTIPIYGGLPSRCAHDAWGGLDVVVSDRALHVLPELAL